MFEIKPANQIDLPVHTNFNKLYICQTFRKNGVTFTLKLKEHGKT